MHRIWWWGKWQQKGKTCLARTFLKNFQNSLHHIATKMTTFLFVAKPSPAICEHFWCLGLCDLHAARSPICPQREMMRRKCLEIIVRGPWLPCSSPLPLFIIPHPLLCALCQVFPHSACFCHLHSHCLLSTSPQRQREQLEKRKEGSVNKKQKVEKGERNQMGEGQSQSWRGSFWSQVRAVHIQAFARTQ